MLKLVNIVYVDWVESVWIHNSTLRNGNVTNRYVLQNGSHYKMVRVTKRYALENGTVQNGNDTKRYVLQKGMLQNGILQNGAVTKRYAT